MPLCLVELGFISNASDVQLLANKEDDIVQAMTRGILKSLNVKYKEDKKESENDNVGGQNKVKIKKDGKTIEVDGFLQNGSNFL